ncbi:hypothetical protein CR513_27816, partial [Mucuna pruriens]
MVSITAKFLHHYVVCMGQKTEWVSLTGVPKSCLFNAYCTSYKGFKRAFCKVRVKDGFPSGAFIMVDQDFSLYWRVNLGHISQGLVYAYNSSPTYILRRPPNIRPLPTEGLRNHGLESPLTTLCSSNSALRPIDRLSITEAPLNKEE